MNIQLPLVIDVKRDSREDGPGIRSVVFFKGCPLRCVFCHNPETWSFSPEIMFTARNCIGCGECVAACPKRAVDMNLPGRIRRDICDGCGRCTEVCPGNGLRRIGSNYSVDSLMEVLLLDRDFYYHSVGGVTLSGGECTMFPSFLHELLVRLKKQDVHVVLETSGYFDWGVIRSMVLPFVDLVYFDLKPVDPIEHKLYTGRSNRLILNNLSRLYKESPGKIQPRIPLVPGITATEKNLANAFRILAEIGASEVTLLPYNPMGLEKYEALGRPTPKLPNRFMNLQEENAIREFTEKSLSTKRSSMNQAVDASRTISITSSQKGTAL